MGFNISLAFAQIHWPMAPTMYLLHRIQKGTKHSLPFYGFKIPRYLCPNSDLGRIASQTVQSVTDSVASPAKLHRQGDARCLTLEARFFAQIVGYTEG